MLLTVDCIPIPGLAGEKPCVVMNRAEARSIPLWELVLKQRIMVAKVLKGGLSELSKLKVEKLIKSKHMWRPQGSC